ncbi:D-glycero-beta-D-manno-heptose 1,7-bisphosphate 7-phosphatase [Candidatus Pseudothioglobus singularis]|nr:D-glycero-beta-D-manno-heptose 1,7-bisphosphate 7-phosphatase [Candidatus Pseudothioglobus singularis]
MTIKTIFLDRDGVINKEINYLHKIEDFEFINGIFEACQYLESLNYKIIITTNQSGISRGYYTEIDFQKVTNWMLGQFNINNVEILDVIYCPHLPSDFCDCRKPKPGMFLTAKIKHNIDMKNSWMIGDKENDIKAANNAGIMNTILVKSGHNVDEFNSNAKFVLDSIKDIHQAIKN